MRKLSLSPKFLLLTVGLLLIPAFASAFVAPEDNNRQAALAALLVGGFQSPLLEVQPSLETQSRGSQKALGNPALQRFFAFQSDNWEVRWDSRASRPNLIQGVGIPLLPGRGNKLALADLKLAHEGGPRVGDVEARLRAFLNDFPELLNVANFDLRLDAGSTVNVGDQKQLWAVEFQQYFRGVPVEGAKVYFRINHGNIVQFGSDKVAEVRTSTKPKIDRAVAIAAVVQALGFRVDELGEILDPGTLKLVPALTAGEKPAELYEGAPGRGYQHFLVWDVQLRHTGDPATWEAKVDAKSGQILSLVDLNDYAQVTGGIYPVTNTDPETVVGLPFANVTNGSVKVTDASGNYTYSSGTATVTLNGKYIKMADTCGSISKSDSSTGNVAFGTSSGTDCTTPGSGGAGNTHATRTGFYHLTNINRKAAGFLTGNAWLNGTLTANMNVNATCNAFWNGSR